MTLNRKRFGLTAVLVAIFCALSLGTRVKAQDDVTASDDNTAFQEALKKPGATPTLPVSKVKEGFDKKYIDEAREAFSNFHMQLGGDHALYYTTHMTTLLPAARAFSKGPVSELERAPDPSIGSTTYKYKDGTTSPTFNEHIHSFDSRLQGIMVLHKGKVVYEAFPGMRPEQSHIWASVAKTVVGTLLTMLEVEGKVDTSRPITDFVPELKGTKWDEVKLSEALNMEAGLDIAETGEATLNPRSVFQRMLAADFNVPNADGKLENDMQVLRDVEWIPGERPGEVARYSSTTTKVLGAAIEGITGKTFTDYAEERIWSKIGARAPLEVNLTPSGVPIAYGLINSTLPDMARYGLLFTPSWHVVSDERVISPQVLRRLQTAGNPEAWEKGDFKEHTWLEKSFGGEGLEMPIFNSHQWDDVWADGAIHKHGNLFQGLYVDPKRDFVAAWFSTSPVYRGGDPIPGFVRTVAMKLAGE